MIIHVVEQGETINSITEKYGVSQEWLIRENALTGRDNLVTGEALVIVYPEQTYTVQEGDTLTSIADKFGISEMELLRNNPYLSDSEFIYKGETLVISYKDTKIFKLSTTGYTYPFIEREVLKRTLPFLTYLIIYSYFVTSEGEIQDINDSELIQLAKEYGVAPIMMLSAFAKNQEEEINATHTILLSEEKQDNFITNVIAILKTKGYYGVNINTPYIKPDDRELYVDFIIKFSSRIKKEGFVVIDSLGLSLFEILTGTIYKGLKYNKLGEIVDFVILLTYNWSYEIGIPSGVVSHDTIKKLLDYLSKEIPPEKIILGIPSIGYVWKLPYEAGLTRGMSISYDVALELASKFDAEIKYDDITKSAFFQYIYVDEFIVRFKDARSINDMVTLIPEFMLNGMGIWNIMKYFPQLWLIINTQYEIEKVLSI